MINGVHKLNVVPLNVVALSLLGVLTKGEGGSGGGSYVITAEDSPSIVDALYRGGACKSPNGITKDEIEAMTELPSTFQGNAEIKSFAELKHFINLHSVDLQGSAVEGDIDISDIPFAESVNLQETYASFSVIGTDAKMMRLRRW